jgi:hypothetical protein
MASRDEKISLYVTQERKNEIERQAEQEDVSISAYLNRLIARQLVREAEDEVAAETRAAERLQQVIDRGTRQLRDATDDLREMQAKTGVYAIANFEFLKQREKEPTINDALSTGARRLRKDVDPIEAETDPTDDAESDGSLDIEELRDR